MIEKKYNNKKRANKMETKVIKIYKFLMESMKICENNNSKQSVKNNNIAIL